MEALCRDIRELAQKRNEVLAENRNLEQCIKEVKDDVCTIQGHICTLKKELPCLKRQYDEQFCCCDEENRIKDCLILDLQCELKRLGKKNTSLQMCGSTLQNEIDRSMSHVHAMEKCFCNLTKKERETECTLNNLRNEMPNECTIEELKEKVACLKICLDHVTAELQEKCYNRQCVLQNLQCIECEREKLDCRENELQKQISDLQENSFKYQSKLRCECVASSKLKEKLACAVENYEEIQNQLKCYEKEVCRMLEERENFLQEIRKEINCLQECCPHSEQECCPRVGQECCPRVGQECCPRVGQECCPRVGQECCSNTRTCTTSAPANPSCCGKRPNSIERGRGRRRRGRLNNNIVEAMEIEIHHQTSSEDFRKQIPFVCDSFECIANYRRNKRRSLSGSKKNSSNEKKPTKTKFRK